MAAQRLQNAKARTRRQPEGSPGLQEQRRLSGDADGLRGPGAVPIQYNTTLTRSDSIDDSERGGHSVHEDYQVPTPPLQTALKKTNMPSSEVAMFLIEIYFSRFYNAHFLFHKATFLADFAANRVPDFIILGIFASASMCVSFPTPHLTSIFQN